MKEGLVQLVEDFKKKQTTDIAKKESILLAVCLQI